VGRSARLDRRQPNVPVRPPRHGKRDSGDREIGSGHDDRVRICANDTCRWIFYDESRSGRRRWCDMVTCGNRAKARRHRERQKTTEKSASSIA